MVAGALTLAIDGRTEVVREILRVRSITSDDTTTWYVVLDDGRSPELDVWKVSDQVAAAAHESTTMRATIAARLGHVYGMAKTPPTGAM